MERRIFSWVAIAAAFAFTSGCLNPLGVVHGEVNVSGSALSRYNITYSIEVGEGWNPLDWTSVGASISDNSVHVNESVLGMVDTTNFLDGNYSFRLTVTDEHNQSSSDIVFVSIDNIALTSPDDGEINSIGGTVNINGTVLGPFTRYRLEYGRGRAPQSFSTEGVSLTGGGLGEVENGTLGAWDTQGLQEEGEYVLRLVLEYPGDVNYTENVTLVFYRLAQGWPKDINESFNTPPVFADIDGDGVADVIASSTYGLIFAWNASGEVLSGWPVDLGMLYPPVPAAGDLTGDGVPEIISPGSYSLHALTSDGSEAPGWPVSLNRTQYSSPVVVDLDSDGRLDVVCADYYDLYAFDSSGSLLQGWPNTISNNSLEYITEIAAADVNGDLKPEVAAITDHDFIHVRAPEGPAISGWPKTPENTTYLSGVALADVDGDRDFEIIVSSDSGRIAVYDGDGIVLEGFPASIGGLYTSVESIAGDVDGDGDAEIIASAEGGCLSVLKRNGSTAGTEVEGEFIQNNIESAHPYTSNFDNTWDVTVPGANSLSVHFTRIDVEDGYDFVYVMNGSDSVVEIFTGLHEDVWSNTAEGDTVKIRLYSDYVITGWGFISDGVLNGSVNKSWPLSLASYYYAYPTQPVLATFDDENASRIFTSMENGSDELLFSVNSNGVITEGWPRYLRNAPSGSPTLGSLAESKSHLGESVDDRLLIFESNSSFKPSLAQWQSTHHDLHNTRAFINPRNRVGLLEPADDARIDNETVYFEFIAWDVELRSCGYYSNATGSWSKDLELGGLLWQRPTNFSLNYSYGDSILWNVMCVNYNNVFVTSSSNRSFTVSSTTTSTSTTSSTTTSSTTTSSTTSTTVPARLTTTVPSSTTHPGTGTTTYPSTTTILTYGVTLNSPRDGRLDFDGNILLTYTPASHNLIPNCTLYHNISGVWGADSTDYAIENNTRTAFLKQDAPPGRFAWNVLCFVDEEHMFSRQNFSVNVLGASNNTLIQNATLDNMTVNASNLDAGMLVFLNESAGGGDAVVVLTVWDNTSRNVSIGVRGLGRIIGFDASPQVEDNLGHALLSFYYSDEEVADAGLSEDELVLYWFDESLGEWMPLSSEGMEWVYSLGQDTQQNILWANVSHLSEYSIGSTTLSRQLSVISGWNLISIPLQLS